MTVRRWLWVWLMVAGVSAVAGLWLGNTMLTPQAGVGGSRGEAPISRLPANAANVTYYLRPPAAYYEFDTDEAGFEEWVGKWRLAWKDRSEGPRTAITWDHAAGQRGEVLIQVGIGCGWWEGDAGWFLTYDRRTGRAYCSGNYR